MHRTENKVHGSPQTQGAYKKIGKLVSYFYFAVEEYCDIMPGGVSGCKKCGLTNRRSRCYDNINQKCYDKEAFSGQFAKESLCHRLKARTAKAEKDTAFEQLPYMQQGFG